MPSGNPVAVAGMFQTIQCGCVSVPRCTETSGSSILRTKLCVPAGTFVHLSSGETCSPACVYFGGICPPSAHAVVVRVIGAGRGWAPPAGFWARAAEAAASVKAAIIILILEYDNISHRRLLEEPLELVLRLIGRRGGGALPHL